MAVGAAEREAMKAEITRLQGTRCIVPTCIAEWKQMAHIKEPSGMGGRPSTWVIGNLAGMCVMCHQIFDGHVMQGRQLMLRDLMWFVMHQIRQDRAMLATQEPGLEHKEGSR